MKESYGTSPSGNLKEAVRGIHHAGEIYKQGGKGAAEDKCII